MIGTRLLVVLLFSAPAIFKVVIIVVGEKNTCIFNVNNVNRAV